MIDLNQVKNYIKTTTRQELTEIARTYNQALNDIIKAEADQFKKGDSVIIEHSTVDPTHIFKVIRVNKKSVTVKSAIRELKVSPKLLRKAKEGSFPTLTNKI